MFKNKNIVTSIIIILIIVVASFFFFTQEKKFDASEYPNETIAMFEKNRIDNPDDIENLLGLALEYNKIDDNQKTEELYKELIEKKPGDIVFYYNLGMLYFYQERFEESAEYLLKGQKINARMYQFYVPLLDLYDDENSRKFVDVDYLISEFKRLDIELGGGEYLVDDYIANITYMARAQKSAGYDKDALETYKKILKLDVGNTKFAAEEVKRLENKLKQ